MSTLHPAAARLSTNLLRLVGSNIHTIADEPGVKLFFNAVYWYYGVRRGRRLWIAGGRGVDGRGLGEGGDVSGMRGGGMGDVMRGDGMGRRRRVPFVVRRRFG